jgi:hypothetical protein
MNETRNRGNGWSRLKIVAGMTVMAFAVTLAVVIANRLSDEALAVLAGAVCGVGAAIPTSLLIVAVSRQRDEPQVQQAVPQSPYPPVVVVAPPGQLQRADAWTALSSSLSAPTQRHFTVVGGSPTDTEMTAYECQATPIPFHVKRNA